MVFLDRAFILRCLALILQPAARFCVRYAIRLPDFVECAKQAFVTVAKEEFEKSGTKQNTSRLSAMTGVHRRDVTRLEKGEKSPESSRDIITKVLGQWRSAAAFLTKSGEPRVLSTENEDSEFKKLVHSVSRDLNPGTILFELTRVGAIEQVRGGVKLNATSYVPKGDPVAGFTILAQDGEDLLKVVEENVLFPKDLPQFHARTEYDNVRPEGLQELRRWMLKEGHQFHSRAREIISSYDQDVNPDPHFSGKGYRVVVEAFSYVDDQESKEKK